MSIAGTLRNDLPELVAIRHDLHSHPELGLEEHRTSDLVARELTAAGWQVTRGLGKTGLVATLSQGSGRRSIGIRADMDALPIHEETGLPYASRKPGLMHACGHDGHTTILLGAAKALARRRNFDGTIHLIFQPAEENFGGARLMMDDGLFKRFPVDAVFALHNDPSLPFGQFTFRHGPVMAAVDEAHITIEGRGGHGAEPHMTTDPIMAGANVIVALQSIVARNLDPLDSAVITVGAFNAGMASNVIPSRATMALTIRSLTPRVRDLLQERITALAQFQAQSFGATALIDYQRSYPPTINHQAETEFLRGVARDLAPEHVAELPAPSMGAEDFAYMLEEVPGSYFFLGAKHPDTPAYPLHHPKFNFEDRLIPIAIDFWVETAERWLRQP